MNLIATYLPLDSAPPIARPIIPKKPKQKHSLPSKGANKRNKNQSTRNIKNIRAVSFMAPDVDVVLKPLIQSFQTPRPYSQSISIWLSSIVFLVRFWRFFTPCRATYKAKQQMISFSLYFLIKLGSFSLIEPLVFLPRFSIEFRRFFHQLNTYDFFFSFTLV